MQFDIKEFSRRLGAIGECDTVVGLRHATMDALALFGIKSAYFIAPLTKDTRISKIVTNFGLPWTWERQYRARLHALDPLPGIALERLAAVCWPDDLVDTKLTAKQARYLAIAAQYGLARGVGVACFGPDGRSGFLGAALDHRSPKPTDTDLQCIHTVAQVAFQAYCRLIKSNTDVPPLSNRELEVLHWIGRGKSNSVIADILGISPSSVDVYVRRIFAKLDVTDRTTASIKAYSLGMLVSAEYEQFVSRSLAGQTPGDKSKE